MFRLAAGVAVIGLSLALKELNCADFEGPCNGRDYKGGELDCPKYKVVDTAGDYQIREYPAAYLTAAGSCNAKSGRMLFWDLFRYITGSNEGAVKMDMTAPVLMTPPTETCKGMTMLFFAPYEYQTGKSLPEPTESDVRNVYFPKITVAVRCYSGYLMQSEEAEQKRAFHINQLYNSLDRDGVDYIQNEAFSAGYDSPMKFESRHNEAWVILEKEAASDA